MSLGSLGRLGIEIFADSAKFTGDLGRVERDARGFAANVQASFSGIAKGLGALGVGLAALDFARSTKQAIDNADALNKMAQKTGLAVDELSRYQYAAGLADLSNETFAKGVKGLSEKLVEANDKTSESAHLLKALGVDTQAGVGPAIEKLADQFAALPDGATKTALAVKLFGKAGQEMIPFLNGGADGIRRMKEEASQLGLVIDKDTAAAAERFNDNVRAMKSGAESLAVTLVTKTAAALADVSDAMKEAYKDSGAIMAAWVALGGVASKVFTDDGLTEVEKVNKRMNELKGELAQVRQRLIDSQDVMGPWGEKLRESLIAASIKGTKELQALNQQLIDFAKAQSAATDAAKRDADAKKAEEKRIKDQLALEDQRKKAAEETKRWNEKLRQEDAKGWIAYVDAITKEYEDGLREEAKLTEDFYREKERMQDLDAKGWIAKIEADTKEYEDELREMAKITADFYAKRDKEAERAREEQLRVYDDLAQSAGNFFADLVMNGKSAFDRLKDSLKSFAAELIALFAKRWVLNMVGSMIPGNMGSTLMQMGSTAGNGSMAGSLLNMGGSSMMAMGASAVGGGLGGYFGAKAMGAGQRGQQVGGITGAGGAMIGMYLGGPIGAAIGALAGALIGKFTDPDGPAQRSAMFGGRSNGSIPRSASSAFGTFGIFEDRWFGDAMNDQLKQFLAGLAALDNGFAQFLKPAELERVKDALAKAKEYAFGIEGSDFSGTLGQILNDRINAIFEAIDPSLKKWLDGFQGTGEELAAYAQSILQVRQALASSEVENLLGRIPELTIDGLMKMQAAGESLSDTFQRVVNEFLQAEANLNQAIGNRNPQFARDLVLQQRNALGVQFANSLGLNYTGGLAEQMALNPQSFGGLNTQQMNLLAQWLNLQTTLEQLDAQLAGGTSTAITNFTNTVIQSTNQLASAQGGLAEYLRGSLLGDLSPLSPMAQLSAARANYERNLGLAQGGDVDAIGAFGGFRDSYLSILRSIVGSSGAYIDTFNSTFNAGAALTAGQVGPLTGASYQQGVQMLASRIDESNVENRKANDLTLQLVMMIAAGVKTESPQMQETLERIRVSLEESGGRRVLS